MLNIRNACADDIEQIMQVEAESFDAAVQESRETFLERIKVFAKGFYVFYEDDSSIAGYFSSELWNDFDFSKSFALGHSSKESHRNGGKLLYISSFALRKEYRGKGLAEELFCRCRNKIREENQNIRKEVLLVNTLWKGAKHIYEKQGFNCVYELENFFTNSDCISSGIVMEKIND